MQFSYAHLIYSGGSIMKNLFNRLRARRNQKSLRDSYLHEAPLCLMDDMVFKIMFTMGTADSQEALRCLVETCTKREVDKVKVLNTELFPARIDGKAGRLDIKVNFNDGEVANLEMQVQRTDDNLKNRAAFYASMLLSAQPNKGDKYHEIKRVYQIFFLDCVLFPDSEKLPRRYKFMEVEEHDTLTEVVEIVFYELPKLEKLVKDYFADKTAFSTLSNEQKWCIYLRYRHEQLFKPLIQELIKEEGIMRAEKSVEKISRSYRKALIEMDRRKNAMEKAAMLKMARDEGEQKKQLEVLELLNHVSSLEELKQKLSVK